MLRQRMSGVISPHRHSLSWCAQGQLYFWRTAVLWHMCCVTWVVPDILKDHTVSSWALKMMELCPFKMSATPHWMTSCNIPKTWLLRHNTARTSNLAPLPLPLPLPYTLYSTILYLILTLKSSNAVTSRSSQWNTSHGQQSLSCDVPCHSD
jgi:hypothetical protein